MSGQRTVGRFPRRERQAELTDARPGVESDERDDSSGATVVGQRRSGAIWAVIVWLMILGVAATVTGGHDAVAGSEINVRLWGSLVLAAGLVLISGAVGLILNTPQARSLAMVAAVVGAVLGGMMFMAQVVHDKPNGVWLVSGAIIAVSIGLAFLVRRVMPEEEPEQSLWTRLPILKSVVSVGVLVSLGQFWYTSIYLPTTAPASLTLESKIDRVEANGSRRLVVSGSVVVRNTSGTRVNVLASTLDVLGEKVTRKRVADLAFQNAIEEAAEPPDTQSNVGAATRYAAFKDPIPIAHGRLVPNGTYFEPGETVTVPFMAWLPKESFQMASVEVWVAVGRGRVLALESTPPDVDPVEGGMVSVTRVPEAGWLRALTRQERYVHVEYSSDLNFPTARIWFAPNKDRKPPDDFDSRMKRFYGYNATTTQALRVLPDGDSTGLRATGDEEP